MVPSAFGLQGHYKDLALPTCIMAGDGDRIVFKRRSEQLHAIIAGSTLQIIKGAGHMVHHVATVQVTDAIERMAKLSRVGQTG